MRSQSSSSADFTCRSRDVGAIEIRRSSEPRGQRRVLLGGQRPDVADAVRRAPRFSSTAIAARDRRLAAPGDVGLVGDEPRLRRVIDVLHEQRVALPGVSTPTASAVTGHCVSHCTAEPKRLAPQNTR